MIMQDNEKKPALRFKGFTDPWEQRKLGELVEIGDIDHRMPETVADGIPYLMTGDFVGTNELNFDGTKMISEEDYCQLSQKIKPEKGDILFARYASVGAARYVDFTRKFLISYSCAIIKKSKKINSKYLYHFITSGKVQQQIKLEINTGSQANIGIDSMKNHIVVSMPPLEEQTKIADALSNLDHLITLHQRKYEKLVNIKKSMLDKMFPKNGASVPEIRFKGFTDLWEQRKLEEYLEVSGQKNFEGIYTKEDVLSVSGDFGIVNQIEFQGRSFAGASVANYGVVETGDIVYTKSPLKSNPYGIIKANKGKNGIVSTLYAVYKPKQSANPEFVQNYFEQDARMNNYMHPLVNKGAKNDMKVSAENALKGQIVFPDIKEQRTISEFFRNLDTLITLHQRKLEKLQNIKKSCLEKMFV